jgi:Mrp family chromosome partitioning ATPase
MRKSASEFQEHAIPPASDVMWEKVYNQLIYTIFQKPQEKTDTGMVVALTSAIPGEGVTYLTRTLCHELAKSEITSVARINARFLRKLYEPTVEVLHRSLSRSSNNISEIGLTDTSLLLPEGAGRWDGSWQYRRDCIDLLRNEFDYALIDCSSLKESSDLLSVAPFVDGVILVIEANRTRREQIHHAERTIEAAQGKLLGHVLNKRTYSIPEWIYRRL